MTEHAAEFGDDKHPYGAGSHGLLLDPAEMPGCYPVKGNVRDDGVLYYHRPDSRSYGATRPEVWFDSPSAAEAAGFSLAPTHPKGSSGDGFEPGGAEHPCSAEDVETNRMVARGGSLVHPYGAGSHGLLLDPAEMPGCYPVKGNVRDDGVLYYHRPDSRSYGATRPEVWFDSPSAAEAAGFSLAPTHPKGSSGDGFEPGGAEHPCSAEDVETNRLQAIEAVAGVEDSDTSGADTASGPSADGVVIAGGTGLAAAALGLAAFKADRHPYGVGSLVGDVDAADYPDFYPVKGNVRIDGTSSYHRPDAQDYRAAPADVWFDSPSAAEAAGFELAPSHPDGVTGDDFEPGGSGHRWSVAEVEEERSRALYGPGWKPSTAMGQDEVSDTDAEADDVEVDVDKTAEVPADQVHTLVSGLPGVDDDSVEGDQAKSGADDSEEGSGVTGAVLAAGAGLGGAEVLGRTVGSDGADSDGADSDGADSDGGNLESEVPEAIGGGIPRIGDLESSTEASVPDLQDDDDETDPASLDLGDVGAVAGGATVVAGGAALLGKALSGDDDLDADAEGVIEMTGDGDAAAGVDINAVKGTADTAKAGKAKAGTAKSKAKKAGAAKADKVKGKAGAAKADATKAAKGGTAKGKELVGAGAGVASRSASPGVGRTRNVAGSGPGGSGGKGLAGGSLGGLADRTGLGRWLWIGLAVLGFLLLALLLSRCGSDSTETSGAATDGPATDGAANAGDDGAADADEPASPTTIEASSAGELRTQALAALGAAGFGDVDVEMDGDNMRLVGNVGSAEDVAAAEAALADLEGMGGLENALVVGDASAAASEDDAAEADAAAEDDAAEADAADGGAAEADAAAGDGAAADSGPAAGEDDEADSGSGAAADDSDDDSDDEDEPETPAAEPVDGDPSYTG